MVRARSRPARPVASGSGSTASGRRAASLAGAPAGRAVRPEEMLLIAGSPSLRRAAIDQLWPALGSPAYADDLATYGRTLQQRNSLLRAIREEQAPRGTSCGSGTAPSSTRRRSIVAERPPAARTTWPGRWPRRTPRSRRTRRRPARLDAALRDERAATRPARRRATPWPAGWPRRPTRRSGTARRSIGPHRDDLVFELDGRDLAGVRVARPAADRDPGLQARRARPPHRARWPPAAAPARRRLLASWIRSGGRISSGGSPPCPRRS